MIDADGYRPNVGIVLLNADGQVFWARRVDREAGSFRKAACALTKRPRGDVP